MRADLQQVAKDALGEREGSVVVLDVQTGGVAAMWSYPSYDPNPVSALDFGAASNVLEFLQESPGDPLLANAYQQRYMPGSTFKVITTGVALEAGVINPQTAFPVETTYVPPLTDNPIQNFEGTSCGGVLPDVFARSCNIPFAKTAIEVGPDRMVAGVQEWGVGEVLPIDLPRPVASTFGSTDNLDRELPLLAIRGFGQNEVQLVPLHMAMIAATVANGGEMLEPHVVDAELDHSGRVLDRHEPKVWKRPISPETALLLNSFMQGVATWARRRAAWRSPVVCPWLPRRGRRSSTIPASRSYRTPGSWRSPRQPAALRRRRDAEGHERRDLGGHRRTPRRADRQDSPRCRTGDP
ncbi:MAG: penicillin-binding transpeptidase domain-containing protein [Ilumatobacteraceae bacterium]